MKNGAVLDPLPPSDRLLARRAPIWWGNRLVILIEAAGLAILVVTYFYIRGVDENWPPTGIPLPDLGISTINVVLLVVSILPMWHAARLAFRQDRARVLGFWLLLCACFGIVTAVCRVLEFKAVHTLWDSNAYGTIVWSILAVHFAHIVAGTLESLAIGILMFADPLAERRFADITANANYWYFVALSWVGLYAIVFLAPRLL
ncbi:MAG: cytochrome c oxidase subunit 3 [Gemmatimonadota bacterium]|nr:cytochrome c oxidase subunit 3 [Gemmatimonadota bacterium]